MNSFDFTGSRLKIKRAKRHFKELETRFAEWLQSDSFRVSVDKNLDTGNDFFKFTCSEAPDDIPVIIGDAVHNLRSALDFIAIEIVTSFGRKPDGIYFPFRETREDVITALSQSDIQLLCPQAADIIIDQIKPYKTGNRYICSLNKLSNTDKHRLLIPIVSRANFSRVPIEHDDHIGTKHVNFTFEFRGTQARSGDVVNSPSTHMEIKDHGRPTLAVFFDKSQLAGIPSLQVLHLLGHCAERIGYYITLFEGI